MANHLPDRGLFCDSIRTYLFSPLDGSVLPSATGLVTASKTVFTVRPIGNKTNRTQYSFEAVNTDFPHVF